MKDDKDVSGRESDGSDQIIDEKSTKSYSTKSAKNVNGCKSYSYWTHYIWMRTFSSQFSYLLIDSDNLVCDFIFRHWSKIKIYNVLENIYLIEQISFFFQVNSAFTLSFEYLQLVQHNKKNILNDWSK